MRLATVLLILLALSAAARAEDFTGFYAGVNAGYAFGRDREIDASAPNAASGRPSNGSGELPPSAAEAARAMRASRPDVRTGRSR
ncbi:MULTISPECIES: hypothetical protein [Methylobacterium]|uniref:hypothetical protein n=1 Tax=Methylobacterium TaxID=407 RepID=UPI0010438D4A|nr:MULTISPECIES: hypothetical protein [Methylobacterium]MDR7038086.1 hypothetical protein [Methylobacterium sp. BE186]